MYWEFWIGLGEIISTGGLLTHFIIFCLFIIIWVLGFLSGTNQVDTLVWNEPAKAYKCTNTFQAWRK